MPNRCVLVILCFFYSTLFAQESKIDTVLVEPYLQLTYGAFFKSLTLKSNDERIEEIQGFDFEWGYQYQLIVESKMVNPALRDISKFQFRLIELLEKKPVDHRFRFQLVLDSNKSLTGEKQSAFEKLNDSTYLYFDQIEIIVSQALSERFYQVFQNQQSKTGTFQFSETGKISLTVLE